MKSKGLVIVGNFFPADSIPYQVIGDVREYNNSPCVIVKALDPDFAIILDRLTLVITENGSALSHLAIIAMEYNKTIIRLDQALDDIPAVGVLCLTGRGRQVEIAIN